MKIRHYGFVPEPFSPEDFLGGTTNSLEAKYGGEIINPEGDWSPYLPSEEDQRAGNSDTFACVSYGTLNAVEMLARLRFKDTKNLSDRFLAKISGTVPGQGNGPKKVADTLRHQWSVNEPEWPDVMLVENFYAPIPEHLKTVAVARGAEFEFGYQLISNTPATIKQTLKRSPVCAAFTAWQEKDGVYVRIKGMQENHWATIVRVLDNGNYLVFDSFAPFLKEVKPEAAQSVAMSYYLNRQVVKESAWKKFVKLILKLLPSTPPGIPEKWPKTPGIPAIPEPTHPPAPDPLEPALIEVESGGDDNAIGDKTLKHKAYGCLQIRQPVCDDVNRELGTSYKAQDMLGNRALSLKVFRTYMSIWCSPAKLGRAVTHEDRARVWNGGPSAWKPGNKMHTATNGYWAKVKKHL
jgi:hypothetical protein